MVVDYVALVAHGGVETLHVGNITIDRGDDDKTLAQYFQWPIACSKTK
jgi:hypothetical protein